MQVDEQNLRHYARCLEIPAAEISYWRATKNEAAWEILSMPHVWQAVQTLAKELKRERTLPGARVREVLAACEEEDEATA